MNLENKALKAMREICLVLPDTEETTTWGKPHFRVKGKIFAGCGEDDGRVSIGFKLEKRHAAALVKRESSCRPAKYVGKHGWITMDVTAGTNWKQVKEFVLESYRLIAPKRSLARLETEAARSRIG